MPVITLNWYPYFAAHTEHPNAAWIDRVVWRRNDDNSLMPTVLGLYIVVDTLGGVPGEPLYAGYSINFRSRFAGRSDALQDLGLNAGVLANRVVRVARLTPPINLLGMAESWLIRYLVLRDFNTNHPRVLQNINKVGPFYAPHDGLTINNNNHPGYLNAQHVYAGGAPITFP